MKCEEVELLLLDFVNGQLPKEEANEMEEHLQDCASCTEAWEETKRLDQAFHQIKQVTPSAEIEHNFFRFLAAEKELQAKSVIPLQQETMWSWKTAFRIAASLLLLVMGYGIGSYGEKQGALKEIAILQAETISLKENMMLAMLDNRSPSTRIKAVNYAEDFTQPDPEILKALIERLQIDTNINVRLAAAEALSHYANQELVRTAFIKALSTEKDPNVQISIIELLVEMQEKRALAPMQELLKQTETPDYVKAKANEGILQIT